MEEKDLRIGNLVDKDGSYTINTTADISVAYIYNPIKLNEDWLNKFGFKKDENGDMWKGWVTGYMLMICSRGFYYPQICRNAEFSCENEQFVPISRIEYVHELQNIWYWITREELKCNV